MEVRIDTKTLRCKHVDKKVNIQNIIERQKIKMIQNLKSKKRKIIDISPESLAPNVLVKIEGKYLVLHLKL